MTDMQNLRPLLLKIIRVRKHLIANGCSRKNKALCFSLMRRLEAWLMAYPKATEAQVRRWAKQHHADLAYLCTGNSGNKDSLLQQLNTQLYEIKTIQE